MRSPSLTRRTLLATGALAALPSGLVAQTAAPTPACGGSATLRQTEGPYFKPRSPERASLIEPAFDGTRVVLEGQVLTRGCRPVPRALVDLWQADGDGRYDNAGYRGRGHVFADAEGRYRFETVVPGLYPGRTRHLHVKVQAAGGPLLTTQLYFPDEPGNQRDFIFRPELLMRMGDAAAGRAARFDFVLDLA